VIEAVNLEAAAFKPFAVVILVTAHQHVGQAGFANAGGSLKSSIFVIGAEFKNHCGLLL